MNFTASPTVAIPSAASSGISISNASSRAITNSTVSRESAPKSFWKFESDLTSPASTLNCSETIEQTFSRISCDIVYGNYLISI